MYFKELALFGSQPRRRTAGFKPGLLVGLLAMLTVGQARGEEEVFLTRLEPRWGTALRLGDATPLRPGQELNRGDTLKTDGRTSAQLLFMPSCQVWVGPNTQVQLEALAPQSSPAQRVLQLISGSVRVTVGQLGLAAQEVWVDAQSVVAAPRGTDFSVERTEEGVARVWVYDGKVDLTSDSGVTLSLEAGQGALASATGVLEAMSGPGTGGGSSLERAAHRPGDFAVMQAGGEPPKEPGLEPGEGAVVPSAPEPFEGTVTGVEAPGMPEGVTLEPPVEAVEKPWVLIFGPPF